MAALPAGTAPQAFQHGHHIFVYSNIRTNQVVYSLTRSLKNNLSLKQLPFLGKKTVPASLRKDLWMPLCLLSFPSPSLGLSTYHKLRELRRLHETTYPLSTITRTEGPFTGQLLPKKKRARVLMNQKANSIADMAAVLLLQSKPLTREEVEKKKRMMRTDGRPVAKRGLGSKPPVADEASIEVDGRTGSVQGVRIKWTDILDAEFAETWPEDVLHEGLERHRYTAAWPPAEPLEPRNSWLYEEDVGIEEEEKVPEDVLSGGTPEASRPTVSA